VYRLRAMKHIATALVVVPLFACSGGSGVDGSKSLTALSDADYSKVCKYYNDKAATITSQTCSGTMQKPMIQLLPCGTSNAVRGSGTCAVKVSDVEGCINGMNACAAAGTQTPPQECILLGNCVQ
jgi:hypothetical protein